MDRSVTDDRVSRTAWIEDRNHPLVDRSVTDDRVRRTAWIEDRTYTLVDRSVTDELRQQDSVYRGQDSSTG